MLPTEAPQGAIGAKVIGSARWSVLTNVGGQVIQFASGVALARLLTPAAFGLVATIWIFSGFATVVFQFGLGQALIHQKRPTERHRSTVFWVNGLSGFFYFGLMLALGPALQSFFDAPGLVDVLPIVASSFLLNLTPVQFAILQKQFRFREIAVIQLSSALAGQLVAVAVATFDKSAVALAIAYPITAVLSTVLFSQRVRWRPKHFIDRQSLRELWAFSGGMLGSQVVAYWSSNVDNLTIGRGLGSIPLALYNRAFNLMLLPVTQVGRALSVVIFPALSSIRDDAERLGSAQLRSSRVIALVLFPVVTGIAVSSPALVQTLWGPRWDAVAPLLEILAFAGIPRMMCLTANWLLQARGRTKTIMWTNVLVLIFTTIGALSGLTWGTRGVAVGVLLANVAVTPFVVSRAVAGSALTSWQLLRNFIPPVSCCLILFAGVRVSTLVLSMSPTAASTLAFETGVGLVLYLGSAALIDAASLRAALQLVRRGSPAQPPAPKHRQMRDSVAKVDVASAQGARSSAGRPESSDRDEAPHQ